MSLDVYVHKLVVPPSEALVNAETREKWLEENDCEITYLAESIGKKAQAKLRSTAFVFKFVDEEWIDWQKTFDSLGWGKVEDYEYYGCNFGPGSEDEYVSLFYKDGTIFGVTQSQQLCTPTEVECICYEAQELGHIRRGASAQFYEDGKWDEDNVTVTKEELLSDWKKYFVEKGEEFKHEIIDNFVEGETVVFYS